MTNKQDVSTKGYHVYEVFSQKKPTSSFESQFSLLAPNAEVALTMAQENFLRRDEEVYNLFVVKREDMHFVKPEQRQMLYRLNNKDYRQASYYAHVTSKWRKLREQAKDKLAKGWEVEG
ncbi:phenylacetic acid degradation B [Caldalkalibacillus thermarum TA2.A1]|uniref:1,2-phenylacetyl-CoA epoxidase subunit B n=1 Tax=Caldalkalibacillus thermarum (strain TA2.A1) TaxID=986075 RepID=F5L515_CALTT|nr:phenylacetic acid degradation B [Caldalkalibacillus thermarum]EGL83552.1 phenylacetic acid degradation B [Caldalkalibacillus thermarum TA2.A1]QZT34488.1 1,2-phenylacetyl-CoA epoxidase subunit B [Caldalkalibacillus thermarum TA2.A1]